jgi:hypothetical protein
MEIVSNDPPFRFQSPEGDSLFFYLAVLLVTMAIGTSTVSFQSPEGDSLFFYPPMGDRDNKVQVVKIGFQSPEGDS